MLIFINKTLQCPQRSLENLKKRVSHLSESHHPTKCLWETYSDAEFEFLVCPFKNIQVEGSRVVLQPSTRGRLRRFSR